MNQPTISEQIVGAWSLVSYEVRAADEIVQHPLGADAVGLLIYGPHRHMTVQIMASDRQRWRAQSEGSQRLSELAAAAEGYLAYAGTYEVDEAARTVTHHVELSLIPNWVGRPQRRAVDLRADHLILTAEPPQFEGEMATPRLTWRRS
jgi:hypothetical protein